MSCGLLVASDEGEGATLYRFHEPPPGSAAQAARRGALARRYRLAPPGAGELRHRLGLHQPHHPHAAGAAAAGGAAGPSREEDEEPGFAVLAADCSCRAAVGAVALPAAPGAAKHGGASDAALGAATLDARGELRLLQQRWPAAEPALHQRCAFQLREPAVALLPGSLGYQAAPEGAGADAAAHGMVAVTAGGAVLALQPLAQRDAQQLLPLQRALAAHPATAPLSGGSHSGFRGTDGSSGQPAAPLLFRHPPPACADAAADMLAPPSPTATAGQEARGGLLPVAAEPGSPELGPEEPAGVPPSPAAPGSSSQAAQAAAEEPPLDAILDAELLQQFLLLPPAEQRQLVAGLPGGSGLDGEALRRATEQLSNLVAALLL